MQLHLWYSMGGAIKNTTFKNADLRGCLKWTLELMRYVGYWFPRYGTRRNTLLYAIYSMSAVTFTLIVYICTGTAYLVSVFGQLEEMIGNLFISLTHACQLLKIMTFIVQRKRIYSLLDCMEEEIFKPKSERQFKKAMIIVNNTNKLAKILVSMVVACVFMGSISTLRDYHDTRQMPIRGLYPFNTAKSPQYELICTYQLIGLVLCGCANAAMDMVAAAFISQICIQLDILSDSIVHIKEFAELRLMDKRQMQDDLCISSELEGEMRTGLIECVKHHLKILAAEVQEIFNIPLFAQFFTAVFTICMTLFNMSVVPINTAYFGELLLYMACMLTEIAIFCWYGNEVIFKCRKLSMSVYNSEWVGCSKDYKKTMLFMMMNMQRQLKIHVGGFLIFSLETLAVVLRSAWSYFLVLHRMHNSES